jgi:hypothetical protein
VFYIKEFVGKLGFKALHFSCSYYMDPFCGKGNIKSEELKKWINRNDNTDPI